MPFRIPDPRSVVSELRRRRVFRVAAGYAVAAWLLIEVTTTVLPTLGLPDWIVRAVVILLLVGFPVAMALAWAFDITSSGVERTAGEARISRLEVRHPWALALTGVALASVAFLAIQLAPSPVAAAFPARGWAVLADAENRTGDPVFDAALTMALALTLEQSAYINIVSGRQIDDALKRMRRDPETGVDAATAREVALREGYRAVLAPSITRVGDRFLLAMRVEFPEQEGRGRTLTVEAGGRDDVLAGLDRLAEELRTYLGESPVAIERANEPLARATTRSLEALKQYSEAFDALRRGRYGDAQRLYRNAIALDSTFALALAGLGMLEWEKGQEAAAGNTQFRDFDAARGIELLNRAVEHLDGVTERERLGILVTHAIAVEGDLERAVAYERTRLEEYPDSYVSHNNIGRMYYYLGRFEESVASYKKAIEIFPGLLVAYDGITATYLYILVRPDSALPWVRRMIERDSTFHRAHDHLGWTMLAMDSLEQAAAAFARAIELQPDHTLARFRLGHTLRLLGRYDSAVSTLQAILDSDRPDPSAHYDIAAAYAAAGDTAAATPHLRIAAENARQKLRQAETPEAFFSLAAVRYRQGDTAAANRLEARGRALQAAPPDDPARAGSRRYTGLDPYGYFELAGLEALRGRGEEAVRTLGQARDAGYTALIWTRMHPDFHSLRGQPPFESFLRRELYLD